MLTSLRGKMIPIKTGSLHSESSTCVNTSVPLEGTRRGKGWKNNQMLMGKEHGFRKSRNAFELTYEEDL